MSEQTKVKVCPEKLDAELYVLDGEPAIKVQIESLESDVSKETLASFIGSIYMRNSFSVGKEEIIDDINYSLEYALENKWKVLVFTVSGQERVTMGV